MEEFLCTMPIANTIHIARALKNEPYVFEGLCSNKRMKKFFGIKEKKTRKAIDYVSSLL